MKTTQRLDAHRKRVYLMRHGEVSYFDEQGKPKNPRDIDLTDNGVEQAKAAADALKDIEFDRVLTSGLQRSRHTAEIVVHNRQLSMDDEDDIKEIHGGRLPEMTDSLLQTKLAYPFEEAGNDEAGFLEGETYKDFETRVLKGWNNFVLSPGWANTLVVAHEGTNRVILAWAAGADRKLMQAFQQDAACINVIDIDVVEMQIKRVTIKLLNHTPYNPAKKNMLLSNMEQVYQTYTSVQHKDKS